MENKHSNTQVLTSVPKTRKDQRRKEGGSNSNVSTSEDRLLNPAGTIPKIGVRAIRNHLLPIGGPEAARAPPLPVRKPREAARSGGDDQPRSQRPLRLTHDHPFHTVSRQGAIHPGIAQGFEGNNAVGVRGKTGQTVPLAPGKHNKTRANTGPNIIAAMRGPPIARRAKGPMLPVGTPALDPVPGPPPRPDVTASIRGASRSSRRVPRAGFPGPRRTRVGLHQGIPPEGNNSPWIHITRKAALYQQGGVPNALGPVGALVSVMQRHTTVRVYQNLPLDRPQDPIAKKAGQSESSRQPCADRSAYAHTHLHALFESLTAHLLITIPEAPMPKHYCKTN